MSDFVSKDNQWKARVSRQFRDSDNRWIVYTLVNFKRLRRKRLNREEYVHVGSLVFDTKKEADMAAMRWIGEDWALADRKARKQLHGEGGDR